MRSCKPFAASTNVVTILGVLRMEEDDEIAFIGVKLGFSLDIGEEGVCGPITGKRMFTHGTEKMRTSFIVPSIRKFALEIIPQVVALVLPDVILPRYMVDDEIDVHVGWVSKRECCL